MLRTQLIAAMVLTTMTRASLEKIHAVCQSDNILADGFDPAIQEDDGTTDPEAMFTLQHLNWSRVGRTTTIVAGLVRDIPADETISVSLRKDCFSGFNEISLTGDMAQDEHGYVSWNRKRLTDFEHNVLDLIDDGYLVAFLGSDGEPLTCCELQSADIEAYKEVHYNILRA